MTRQSSDDLTLHADQPRRTGYLHPLKHYVGVYGTKLRGIQTWIANGEAATPEERPPLDDPEAMVGWWMRHSTQTVPAKLHLAASRARVSRENPTPLPLASVLPPSSATPGAAANPTISTAAALPSAPTTPPPKSAASTTPPSPPDPDTRNGSFANVDGMTLAEAMPHMGKVLALAVADYEKFAAATTRDETAFTMAANRLDKVLESHRKLETTLINSAQKRGELIPLADLRPELTRMVNSCAASLVDKLQTQLGLTRAAAIAFADEWFADLRDSRFCNSPPAPELRAAA